MTGIREENIPLAKVSCIHYPVQFRKDPNGTQALLNNGSKVNIMNSAYISRLGLRVYRTNIGAQIIDSSTLETFGIVLASFQVEDKLRRIRFFQEIFLLADISTERVLDMFFLTFSNADIQFVEKEPTWRTYNTAKALPTTKRVELIDKKKFAKMALDEKSEAFVVHVASFNLTPEIYLNRAAQIASLLAKEVKIPDEYSDFADVFPEAKALVLPDCNKLNDYAIDREDGK